MHSFARVPLLANVAETGCGGDQKEDAGRNIKHSDGPVGAAIVRVGTSSSLDVTAQSLAGAMQVCLNRPYGDAELQRNLRNR